MEDTNIDRVLGMLCVVLILAGAVIVFVEFPGTRWLPWLLLVAWTIGLYVWAKGGLKKIEVGWRGQLLFLGERYQTFFREGWRWTPFPFGVKVTDCRQTVVKLDPLEVITLDNVKVKIDGSIIRQVADLDKFFGVEESGIKQGLDDIWDQTIRANVKATDLEEVLQMHAELGQQVHDAIGVRASESWGIDIPRVIIAGIEPDPEVTKDLALLKREELQREGQKVEFKHFADRVLELMAPPPVGPGLSREQAIEQVQLALGKATKAIDAKTIALDSATAALVVAILGRK